MYKKNKQVYFYVDHGDFTGEIASAKIVGARKDLFTGEIVYKLSIDSICYSLFPSWLHEYGYELTADKLYTSLKKITAEYKDEIAYNSLRKRCIELEKTLDKIVAEYAEKIKVNPTSWCTLDINKNSGIIVDGIGNLQDEFNKLKKEVSSLKKRIKPKTKKAVPGKKPETPDIRLDANKASAA